MTNLQTDQKRELLRHTLATLAYRGAKALREAPDAFATFAIGEPPRSPVQVLAHLGDLLDWALAIAKGQPTWNDSKPLPWDDDVARFFASLGRLDAFLASGEPLAAPPEKLFQGPVADALGHVGQIAMLRRLAGDPIRGENYFRADIVTGRVGPEQSAPRKEF